MYPNSAIMEVEPDEASGKSVVLGDPFLDLLVDDGLKVGAGSRVMVEAQIIGFGQELGHLLWDRWDPSHCHDEMWKEEHEQIERKRETHISNIRVF